MGTPILTAQTVRRAYYWTTLGYLAKNLSGFGISMLLAHLLSPGDYGLVGMVMVLIGILSTLQDFSLGQAVVYFPEDEDVLPTAFTVTTGAGLLLTMLGVAGAPMVAAFYREPRLTAIVRVLSVTLFLGGLRSVSQGLMAKRMEFRNLAFLEGVGTIAAGLTGVVMAWKGFGVWSLVTNLVLSSLFQTILTVCMVRPRVTVSMNWVALKRLMKWGLPNTGGTLLWQFYDNSDFMIIGKLIGSVGLGYYTMAFRLSTIVNDKISSVVNRVSFPSLSALQDNPHELVDHWFSVSRKLALVSFPILVAIGMNAEDFIGLVLGPQWLPAVAPLRYLCVVGAVKTLSPIVNSVIAVYGRTDVTFYFALLNSVVLPLSFLTGCKLGGPLGVAIAWSIVYPIPATLQLRKALQFAQVGFWKYWTNLKFSLLVTAACGLAMLPFHWAMHPGMPRLVARSGTGLLVYGLCLLSREGTRNLLKIWIRKWMRFARSAPLTS